MKKCLKGGPYPLSLLPDPDALQQVVDDLCSVLAAVRRTTDVGNLIWTSPIICKKVIGSFFFSSLNKTPSSVSIITVVLFTIK